MEGRVTDLVIANCPHCGGKCTDRAYESSWTLHFRDWKKVTL